VRGLPIQWKTVISTWEPPFLFVDEALRSPYRHWHHEHQFESCAEGTRVIDTVHYGVPGGTLVHSLFVRRDVERIFKYRHEILKQLIDV
jgi:ligand-binding SRPBCC domain-containing protein